MVDQLNTIPEIMAALSNSDARTRMQGIIALSKKIDATVDALMSVGRLLDDKSEFDPSPSTYGPVFIPKWIPNVQACATFFLPYIAATAAPAVRGIIVSLPSMSANDRSVATKILGAIGLPALVRVLLTLEEGELCNISSILGEQDLTGIKPLLDAFSSTPGERPQRVISYLASEGQETITRFLNFLHQVGRQAIPFLSELIRFNVANPYPLSFTWKMGLAKVFSFGTVRYLTAIEAISVLERMGAESRDALMEASRSPIKKIHRASKKALQRNIRGS